MLLVLRIVTIIISIACLAISAWLIIAGLNDEPKPDMEAVWFGMAPAVFYLADLFLVYYSYKKKHTPVTWVAFLLAILPVLAVLLIVWISDKL